MSATMTMPEISESHRISLLRLLIVDDERSIREGCRETADSLGFQTTATDRAERAYAALDTEPVDIVLLDLKLPGTSGLEVLQEIKRRVPGAPSRSCVWRTVR